IAAGDYPQIPQDHITDIKHAPKIFKETCRIDWNRDVTTIYNFIRGLSPYPAAFTTLDGKVFKIYKAEKELNSGAGHKPAVPGSIETDGKTYLRFRAIDGTIDVKECQMEGKKRLSVGEFLRGYSFPQNS
ncbi:MAG TPA: hypothetical protein VK174_10080, partial [Chitinophagales bacterium]|nr:hypothetical protein [Chitinophagales bacterium]